MAAYGSAVNGLFENGESDLDLTLMVKSTECALNHKDFLRVRTKHKERVKTVAFMTEMRRAVPTADEETIKEHIDVFQKMQDMIERKKELMKQYKEAKKASEVGSKIDAENSLYGKLNGDLDLDGVAKPKRAVRQLSEASRSNMKAELDKWKQEKEKKRKLDVE